MSMSLEIIENEKIRTLLCADFGAPAESRTPDTMIKSHVLYLLSYRGIYLFFTGNADIITRKEGFVKIFFPKGQIL